MPVNARIQIRRDTSANWLAAPAVLGRGILYEGELGLETDTGLIKVGNGQTAWASLAYLSGGGSGTPVQGAQGTDGAQGSQGIQGPQGAQGPQGVQGAQGIQGAQGAQGAQGSQGLQGTQGLQGIQGSQGLQGRTASYETTSSTSNTISAGANKTFTVETGLSYSAGQRLLFYVDSSNYMEGTVVSYDVATGALVMTPGFTTTNAVSGTTYNSWTINLTGIISRGVVGTGTDGYLAQWNGSTNLVNSAFYQDGTGKIGVNTTSPTSDFTVLGSFSATSKSFDIAHPSRKRGRLVYGSLESPYHGVRLTGEGIVSKGKCVIRLPKYIKDLVKAENATVMLSNYKHGKNLFVDEIDISKNTITIKVADDTKEDLAFFWDFTAIRKDIPDLVVEP